MECDWQATIVVSKSTGRAAYLYAELPITDVDSDAWFPSLYELLRKVEVAAEENRLSRRNGTGTPWSIDDEVTLGGEGICWVDSGDESEGDTEEDDDREEDQVTKTNSETKIDGGGENSHRVTTN
jgi:hypothetical protein